MKTIIDNVYIKAVNSWLPEKRVEMTSFNSLYGEAEVASIIKATGVERIRVAEDNMTSSDMCIKSAEALFVFSQDVFILIARPGAELPPAV